MQVHWGSLVRLGEAGVDTGFLRPLRCPAPTPPFTGSSLSEYDDEAFRENLKEGDCEGDKHEHVY